MVGLRQRYVTLYPPSKSETNGEMSRATHIRRGYHPPTSPIPPRSLIQRCNASLLLSSAVCFLPSSSSFSFLSN